MAINQLQLPGAFQSPSVDLQSSLANLGQVYKQAQQDQLRQQALSSLGQGGAADANALIRSGDMSLAQLGLNLRNRQDEMARQAERDKILDARSDREFAANQKYRDATLALQRDNQDYTPQERAKLAIDNGIDPRSPQGRAFVLTGKLPEADTSFLSAVEQRKAVAAANNLDPASPGYQSFVLTGKMPREDAQPLTAGDKEAIRTADDAVLSNRSAIESLNRAKGLSRQAFVGPTAGARGYAASFLGESSDLGKGGIATENLTNEVMTNALGQLKAIFGGNPTEGERKILLDLQGSVSKPDSVRQAIFDRAIGLAQKKLEYNQRRADELRGGTYYKNKPTQTETAPSSSPSGNGAVVDWRTYFGGAGQ